MLPMQYAPRPTLIKPRRIPKPLFFPPDSRGIITGASGSGKSYLAKSILVNCDNPVIIDSKWDFEPYSDATIYHTPDAFIRSWLSVTEGAILYRPDPIFDDVDDYDAVFREIFNAAREGRRRSVTYVDEVTLVAPSPQKYPRFLKALCNQGRSLGAGLLTVTQRPVNIPQFLVSESLYCWLFRLNLQDDLLRMASIMGNEVLKTLDRYAFWFRDIIEDERAHPFIISRSRG